MASKDDYNLYRYYQHNDFRTALGLQYIVALGKACRFYNKLEPVLSLPLGTSDLTASEVKKCIKLLSVERPINFIKMVENQITYIRRIEDRYGKVLFSAEDAEQEIVPIHRFSNAGNSKTVTMVQVEELEENCILRKNRCIWKSKNLCAYVFLLLAKREQTTIS